MLLWCWTNQGNQGSILVKVIHCKKDSFNSAQAILKLLSSVFSRKHMVKSRLVNCHYSTHLGSCGPCWWNSLQLLLSRNYDSDTSLGWRDPSTNSQYHFILSLVEFKSMAAWKENFLALWKSVLWVGTASVLNNTKTKWEMAWNKGLLTN